MLNRYKIYFVKNKMPLGFISFEELTKDSEFLYVTAGDKAEANKMGESIRNKNEQIIVETCDMVMI